MKLALGLVVLCLVGVACQRDRVAGPAGPTGHERSDCRPDKTCDPGLICLSDLCVRPPAADCQAVAEQLTSIELGNYAEPEARAPLVARHRAACDAALVSKEEAQCIDKARNQWSASRCVPRMFPQLAPGTGGDCAAVVAKTRVMMENQATYLNDPKMKAWFDRTMSVMQESCEQDQWPDALKKCMLAADSTAAASQACNQQMPPELQQRMQQRLSKAMQELPRP